MPTNPSCAPPPPLPLNARGPILASPPASSLSGPKGLAKKDMTRYPGYISTTCSAPSSGNPSPVCGCHVSVLPTIDTTFASAVNVRRYLTSQQHTGDDDYSTVQQLIEEPLAVVASQLLTALHSETSNNLEYNTRTLATTLNQTTDRSTIPPTATIDPSMNIILSSWAQMDFFELNSNLGLGKLERVRLQIILIESLLYLIPRISNGEIAPMVCLRYEDLERSRAAGEFMKYVSYIE
ncbi:hypothetical protein EMCG_06616 [[Emmonsia] crescens]|uniref:Uncharacterized protein n=1 Tax=[Emmonsia] crescens TaxID=73230 RepID=A0A0G2J6L9_9EURO|nr:hypothetical protein EMCG_06616 [Emmonsia crescens UAMH 3008]